MNLSKHIKETQPIQGVTLRKMRVDKNDAVTITGSIPVGSEHMGPMIAEMTAKMLDEETKNYTKQQLAKDLESMGAKISFTADTRHTRFKIRCRKKDINKSIELLVEQLANPTFPSSQLKKVKKNVLGNLEQERENTRARALNELTRQLYKSEHPNYKYSIDERIKAVKKISVDNLKKFHRNYYGRGDIKITAVGAYDNNLDRSISEQFAKLSIKTAPSPQERGTQALVGGGPKQKMIKMEEKESVDVFFGQTVPINKNDEDYIPLLVGMAVLGYGFTGRLMKNVRNKKGLTYGTGARLKGFREGQDGYWIALGMFAPQLLNAGVEAMEEEIKKLFKKGASEKEVEKQKIHLMGIYKIALSSTEGASERMLTDLEVGRDTKYIDDFIEDINKVTKSQVNKALKKYCDPEKLVMTAAGTI